MIKNVKFREELTFFHVELTKRTFHMFIIHAERGVYYV